MARLFGQIAVVGAGLTGAGMAQLAARRRELAVQGHLGRKTGRGFCLYDAHGNATGPVL